MKRVKITKNKRKKKKKLKDIKSKINTGKGNTDFEDTRTIDGNVTTENPHERFTINSNTTQDSLCDSFYSVKSSPNFSLPSPFETIDGLTYRSLQ